MDRLLGRVLRRLKAAGIYDDTAIVLTADHGFAWQVGVATRRSVSTSNVHELMTVPMLVKRPGQAAADTSAAYVQTLDVSADDRRPARRPPRLPHRWTVSLRRARSTGAAAWP